MTDEQVIEVKSLSRWFGKTRAVDSVSFSVNRGEIFGFFGPNGAGKTTTIRLLCGLLPPSSGSASVLGYNVRTRPAKIRCSISILEEEVVFYEKMTSAAYLKFFARMAGYSGRKARARIAEVVEISEISPFLRKRLGVLSHGQRQKVSIARVLLKDAPVMFLDEPFSGIDIIHRKKLREYLRSYVERGNTVFFTSHNLIEAEHIVDRFAFIDSGKIVMIGTSRELRDRYLLPSYALRVSDPTLARHTLAQGLDTTECRIEGDEVIVTLHHVNDVPRIARLLGDAGVAMMEMRHIGTMEEVFLSMRREQGGSN